MAIHSGFCHSVNSKLLVYIEKVIIVIFFRHKCWIPPCPSKSYPGLWEVPLVHWEDLLGYRCAMADACHNPGDADEVYQLLMNNFKRHYETNRAPFGMYYHSAWFIHNYHMEGFKKFLDTVLAMPDVWIVTASQAIQVCETQFQIRIKRLTCGPKLKSAGAKVPSESESTTWNQNENECETLSQR